MEIELLELESVKSSVSYPESVRSQTKQKFDALLKNALKTATPPTKSKNTEFNKSSERLLAEDCEVLGVDNEGFKAPIPKPRRSKNVYTVSVESGESGGTYKVSSPKVLTEILGNGETKEDDAATYTKSPVIQEDQQIGDILVHSNTSPVIPILEIKSPAKNKNDDSSSSSSILVVETKRKPESEEIVVKYEKPPTKTDDVIDYENETEKPKPKKRTKKKDGDEELQKYDFENITAVVIHKTDRLQLSSLVTHPLVSVHIFNSESGRYLKKSDKNRAVTFYYEDKKFDYIAPILTQVYNMRKESFLIPQWEETLLFNEDFEYILQKENNVIIFFEIVEFLTLSEVKKNESVGWKKIAWAFLKPLSKDGFLNTGKRVRLQLYKPGKYSKKNMQECDVFQWWSKQKWVKYPASLHVTVKKVPMPQNVEKTMRSRTPLTAEIGSKEVLEIGGKNGVKTQKDAEQKIKWRKIEHQTCKMPNKCLAELETCSEGAFVVKFSNKGDFLAVAVFLNDVYTIKVFETETWEIQCYIPTHQSLIYSIVWSTNDDIIVSASADCTVSLWDFIKNSFIQMLPHPYFVYSCSITKENVIATGCYDKIVRIWKKNTNFVLRQELEKHSGYVTSLVFNKEGNLLYSADSVGVIVEWTKKGDDEWNIKRAIQLVDLKETIVNQIYLCKRETKMIVHARDSMLRVVDLETESVLHWLRGVLNSRIHTKCSLSPCGNFVTSGSENGLIQVWNIYTEKCVATYTPYCDAKSEIPIHDVQFHPIKNVMVFAHFGTNIPIVVYYCHHDENSDEPIATTNKNEVAPLQQRDSKLDFNTILCKIDQIIKAQT